MQPRPIVSLEFFAPRTPEGVARLRLAWAELGPLAPAYFSVTRPTDEAGPERTLRTIQALRAHFGPGVDLVPHLTCVGSSRESARRLLAAYRDLDVRHLVLIRGDLPPGMREWSGDFPHASDLVAFVRGEPGDPFHIEVAAHPEFHPDAPSPDADLAAFQRKAKAGATSALTQYFYNADAYVHFVESCRRLGLTLPIVPGIMPITNVERLARFSQTAGVEIPRWLRRRLEALASDPQSVRAFGIDVVTRLCERLLEEGAPGLHFYTLNTAEPTRTIWTRLGLGCGRTERAGSSSS
jgi:methylenetetrahydrofolate reductase (NADPH)